MGLSYGSEFSSIHGGHPEAAGGRLEAIRGHFHALFSVTYYVSLRHTLVDSEWPLNSLQQPLDGLHGHHWTQDQC